MSEERLSTNPHHHLYLLKGSTYGAYWAECECGERLTGRNGPIVGGKRKVLDAIAADM